MYIDWDDEEARDSFIENCKNGSNFRGSIDLSRAVSENHHVNNYIFLLEFIDWADFQCKGNILIWDGFIWFEYEQDKFLFDLTWK